MDKKNLLAISYARKSVKVKGLSVEESVDYQQVTINNYATANNMEIVKSYHDVGYTGRNTQRPELIEMLNDLSTQKVDVLLIYTVDRFGRDLKNNIEIMLKISDKVNHIVFIAQGLSSNSEYFKPFFLMLTGLAQEELNRLMRGLADGRKAKVLNRGYYDGKYPLGYMRAKESKAIIPSTSLYTDDFQKEQELLIVQFIFYCFIFNMSLRKIATLINERFGKTKQDKKWSYKSVRYVLSNPIYSGFLSGVIEKKEKYFIKSENIKPIVDPLLHEIILKRLEIEKPGRKKNTILRPPFHCICFQCGIPLIEEEEVIYCPECMNSELIEILKGKLLIETTNLINEIYPKCRVNFESLQNQYDLTIKVKKRKMKQLEEVKILIEKDEDYGYQEKQSLLKINSTEACNNKKELILAQEMLKILKNTNKDEEEIDEELLILLPNVIIIDFQKNEVSIIFHPSIFNEGGLEI